MSDQQLLQVCNFPRAEAGSFIPFIAEVLRRAQAQGWRAKAVFTDPGFELPWLADFERQGLEAHVAGGRTRRERGQVLAEFIDAGGPAILHTHFTTWDVAAVRVARSRPDTRVFWHVHSTLPTSAVGWARNAIKFGLVARSVDQILCPAPNVVEGVKARFGPRERVSLFPSAIDLAQFPATSADERRRAREELGIPAGATALLHFGWHWRLKGGRAFVETVRKLVDAGGEGIVALERGGGEEARADVDALGLGDVVRFIDPLPSIRPLFAAADVVVSSSASEGMAYSVLEALASGAPVVATRIPGHALIGEHVTACRLAGSAPEALAAAVRETLDRDPAQASAEREQARMWLQDHLSVEVLAARLLELYRPSLTAR